MSADLTLASARSDRDALAARIDVLDKVKVLRTLPDDMHVTTDMVAEFYEVPVKTIQTIVLRNREEFDEDGYRVVTRSAFEDAFKVKVSSSANSFALFPRRAVLRAGMLLRDSAPAGKVRGYLLDSEQRERTFDPTNLTRMQILELAMDSERRALELAAKVEADRPMVERAKNHASGTGLKTRQQFFREVKQWAHAEHGIEVRQAHVIEFLSTEKLRIFARGNRSDSGHATAWAIEKGYAVNKEDTAENGHNFVTGKLTARGQEYAWDRIVRYIDANGTLELPRQIGIA